MASSRNDRVRLEYWTKELRRVRPAAVVVVWEGGEQAVAIRTGATRWQHAAQTALVLATDHDGHVELRDPAGAVVEMLSLQVNEDGDELDEPSGDGDQVALSGSDARLLGVLISAQRMVLQEQRELLEPVLSSFMQLAQAYAQYAAQVVELVRLAARVPTPEGDSEGNALMREFMATVTGRAPAAPVVPTPPAPGVTTEAKP